MIDRRTQRALEDCLRRLRAGAAVEECLAAYPRQRKRLEPLLHAAAALYREPSASLSEERKRVQYSRLMATIRTRPERKTGGVWGWTRLVLVPVAAAATAAALIFGLNRLQAPDMAEAATTLTVLQGDVNVTSGQSQRPAADGMTLLTGDSIATAEGARAVVTFLDGSSITLESDTQVTIRSISTHNDSVSVLVFQSRGRTWTWAPGQRQSTIDVETPSTRLSVHQAAFAVLVDQNGKTQVNAHSGGIEITSGGKRTSVSEGSVEVDREGQITKPAAVPTPGPQVVIRASQASVALLSDQSGASVGYLSTAAAVNQVPASSVSRSGNDVLLRLPAPSGGLLRLLVGTGGQATASVTISVGTDIENFSLPAGGSGFWSILIEVEQGDKLKVSKANEVKFNDLPPSVASQNQGLRDADHDGSATPRERGKRTPEPMTPRSTPSASPTRTPSVTPMPSLTPALTPGLFN